MKKKDIKRLDAIPHGTECRVAFVRDGLNVAAIAGLLQQRRPGGAWRVETPDAAAWGFINPEDKVTIFKGNSFRVDLP